MTPIKLDGPNERPEEFRAAHVAYYGSAQEIYNVAQGQVWAAGEHRFICADVLLASKSGLLRKHIPEVDVIYTDAPWTPGIYTQFYTNAGGTPDLSFEDFLSTFCGHLRYFNPNGLCLLEIGKGAKDLLVSCLAAAGAHTLALIPCTYTKRHTTYWLWVGSFNSTVTLPGGLLTTGRHENQVILSIAHTCAGPGIRFLDPLCGQMTFIAPAAMRGSTVYGVELIPRKFAEGLRSISRIVGQPHLVEG